jgi:hypothetical protein
MPYTDIYDPVLLDRDDIEESQLQITDQLDFL